MVSKKKKKSIRQKVASSVSFEMLKNKKAKVEESFKIKQRRKDKKHKKDIIDE